MAVASHRGVVATRNNGSVTFQAVCWECPWRSDRVKAADRPSDKAMAPVTNQVARLLQRHWAAAHAGGEAA